MPVRHARARRSMGRTRRRVIWAEYDSVVNFTAVNTLVTLDLLQTFKAAVGSTVAKATVMRTHCHVVSITGQSAGARLWTALSVQDLNDINAVPALVATVANPRDDPYTRWAYFSRHSIDAGLAFQPSGVGDFHPVPGQAVGMDLKMKRKLDNVQETWALTILSDTGMVAATTMHVFARTLIALP